MYDPRRHHRRSIRLRGYDYREPGEYFVTICTRNRECVLGEIKDGEIRLSNAGDIAERCWYEIPAHFGNVGIGAFVIMPNHLHGVILLRGIPRGDEVTSTAQTRGDEVTSTPQTRRDEVTSSLRNVSRTDSSSLQNVSRTDPDQTIIKRPPTLGQVVAFYKYRSTKLINETCATPGERFWQGNYHEHIIRDGNDHARIQNYIAHNVNKWIEDEENPRAGSGQI